MRPFFCFYPGYKAVFTLFVLLLLATSLGEAHANLDVAQTKAAPFGAKKASKPVVKEKNTGAWLSSTQALPGKKEPAPLAFESVLKEIEHLQWFWPEVSSGTLATTSVRFVSFLDVLQRVQDHSPEILVAREKIVEINERKHGVQGKRILFFFKYFNSSYLEGSAKSDLDAASAHAEFTRQQVLYDTFQVYVHWLEAALNHYAVVEKVKHQWLVYQATTQRFWSGDVEAFEVLQARNELVNQYKSLLEARNTSHHLSRQLQLLMGESTPIFPLDSDKTPDTSTPLQLFPLELTFSQEAAIPKTFNPQLTLSVVLPGIPQSVDTAVLEALHSRQDLAEAAYRTLSMENLFKAAQFELDKSQVRVFESNYKQFKIRESALREQIRLAVEQALESAALADQKVVLAQEQLDLASDNLAKTTISFKAGFSSQNELADAHTYHQQLMVQRELARLQQCLAQAKHLHEMGLFSSVLGAVPKDRPTL
jgi:hypothetical protein